MTKPKRQINKPSEFARRLLVEWNKLELPRANATVIVGVSGGGDSTALLLALDELIKARRLTIAIVVAHLNHKLRGKTSDADAQWVSSLSKDLGHSAVIKAVGLMKKTAGANDNLEQAARRARYDFFNHLARTTKAKIILTAHTMDDQAETVLLNLLRGSGAAGLSGIEPVRRLHARTEVLLARPFLSWARRADTENYCQRLAITFRLDEMNADEKFARVRIRNRLLPLMKSFNPRFVEGVARTAENLREDNIALESAARHLLELSLDVKRGGKTRPGALRADLLRLALPALRRRALRQWLANSRGDLRRLEQAHITALERFLFNTKSGRAIELPGGGKVLRNGGFFFYEGPRANRRS